MTSLSLSLATNIFTWGCVDDIITKTYIIDETKKGVEHTSVCPIIRHHVS